MLIKVYQQQSKYAIICLWTALIVSKRILLYKTSFLTLFIFFSFTLSSQPITNSKDIETETYRLYQEAKWKQLKEFSEKAVDDGIDYYYLRIRAGIACFQLKKYRKAISHFKKAITFDSSSDVAKEYLYYCYLYAGNYIYAGKISKKINSTLPQNKGLAYSEGGIKYSGDTSFHNASYAQLGFSHKISKAMNLSHAFTIYEQLSYITKTTQFQYYLNFALPVGREWTLSPAFHYVNYQVQPSADYISWFSNVHANNYVGSLSLTKTTTYLNFNHSFSASNLSPDKQLQSISQFSLFPFASNTFSISPSLFIQWNDSSSIAKGFGLKGKIDISKKIRLHLQYFKGNMFNYTDENALIINNDIHLTENKYSIMTQLFPSNHFSIYFIYQYENKMDRFSDTPFHYNNLFLGLQFNF